MGSVIRMSWSAMGGKQRDCRGSVRVEARESSVFAPCLAPCVQASKRGSGMWFTTYYSALIYLVEYAYLDPQSVLRVRATVTLSPVCVKLAYMNPWE